jgi:hypothetical protein
MAAVEGKKQPIHLRAIPPPPTFHVKDHHRAKQRRIIVLLRKFFDCGGMQGIFETLWPETKTSLEAFLSDNVFPSIFLC